MLRIRWTDPADDPAAPVGWQPPSLILATLFLNFFFWYVPANQFWFSGSPVVFFASLGTVAVLVLGLFFLGPAFAAHDARRSLFEIAEASFGAIPAIGFRLACAVLCVLWIAGVSGSLTSWCLNVAFNRDLSVAESGLFNGLLMLFLFATGLQSLRTSARLALFTNKLGLALLVAAAIRVRGYLPDAWSDLNNSNQVINSVWSGVVEPLMFIGPMAFLAADFGCRARTRKDVAFIGIFGLALPMAGTLFVVSMIYQAAHHWRPGYGGLANIALALWGGDSRQYVPPWMMLALITTFGVARFGVRMCSAAVSSIARGRKVRLAALAAALVAATLLSASQSAVISSSIEVAARLAASAAAVLSADYLTKRWRTQPVRKVDWLGLGSLVAGCAAGGRPSFWASGDYESLVASILMSYAASFIFCLAARAIQHLAKSKAITHADPF